MKTAVILYLLICVFLAHVDVASFSQLCTEKPVIVTVTKTKITSPGFPKPFEGNLSCKWKFRRADRERIMYMNAYPESDVDGWQNDCLKIVYNDSRHRSVSTWWCMERNETFYFDTDEVTIQVATANNTKAFQLFVSLYLGNKPYGFECNREMYITNNQFVQIKPPFYDSFYNGPIDCKWELKASNEYALLNITVNVIELDDDGQCSKARLELFDAAVSSVSETYCERTQISSTGSVHGKHIVVRFVTESTNHRLRPFMATVSAVYNTGECNARKSVEYHPKFFVGTNEFRDNTRNNKCSYSFYTDKENVDIVAEFLDYDIGNCETDRIVLNNGKTATTNSKLGTLCGFSSSNELHMFTATSDTLLVHFISKSSDFKAFKIRYYLRPVKTVQLKATSKPQYFQSPNFPRAYNRSSKYQWRIDASIGETVFIEVLYSYLGEVDAKGRQDSVKVFNGHSSRQSKLIGEISGEESTTFQSSVSSLLVELYAIAHDNKERKGIKIKYYQLEASGKSISSIIIGVVVSVVVIVTLMVACCLAIRWKKTRSRNVTQDNNNQPNMNFSLFTPLSGCLPAQEDNRYTVNTAPCLLPQYSNAMPPSYFPPTYEESERYELEKNIGQGNDKDR